MQLPRAVVPLAVVCTLSFLTLAAVARAQYFFPLDYTVQELAQGARHPLLEPPVPQGALVERRPRWSRRRRGLPDGGPHRDRSTAPVAAYLTKPKSRGTTSTVSGTKATRKSTVMIAARNGSRGLTSFSIGG